MPPTTARPVPIASPANAPHAARSEDTLADLAFDFAPTGLVVLENRVVRRCNQHFARMFGGTPDSYQNTQFSKLYPSIQEFEAIGARWRKALRTTGRYQDERVMRRRDGTLFWCRARGQSLTPEDPFRQGIWSFADLSDERPLVELTRRERDVAILTCRGLTCKEIGKELDLSYRTIEVYRARLLKKFKARKLAELVAKLAGTPL
ncbi:helix-turn-helix transcriptional regulator [Litorivita pollutaquae]|uniref:Helix-turn-helix transcriptional regulator n=1 Tax=Litorivita pollutaquae TaxID=2200892 RepID=A0A2V4MW98_9RHOB|nr:helix-turn-helix transcriptional regulator [Litorivita pollutaquae]PYC46734.1 helix-turn-helix transcriptional regulator [Litorivita pollutaquae]